MVQSSGFKGSRLRPEASAFVRQPPDYGGQDGGPARLSDFGLKTPTVPTPNWEEQEE
jgi:hypothetical protein